VPPLEVAVAVEVTTTDSSSLKFLKVEKNFFYLLIIVFLPTIRLRLMLPTGHYQNGLCRALNMVVIGEIVVAFAVDAYSHQIHFDHFVRLLQEVTAG
jgi:hypothetical protein